MLREKMSVSQQTAKKFFSLQSFMSGRNASRHLFCPQKYYKAMKIYLSCGECGESTGT